MPDSWFVAMLEFSLDVYNIRILLAIGMLVTASILDFWKREIHDLLWIIFAVAAVLLLFFEPSISNTLIVIAISMIIAPLSIVMWRIGIFGGADAFCLIVLAALVPMVTLSNSTTTPFTTIANAAILSLIPLFANVVRNTIAILHHKDIFDGFDETKLKKTCAMFLGHRSVNPKYSFSIEKLEDGQKKLNFSLHHAENADFCNTKDTWVTPGIPYILYIAGGFLIQLFFGDLFLNVFGNFFIMR